MAKRRRLFSTLVVLLLMCLVFMQPALTVHAETPKEISVTNTSKIYFTVSWDTDAAVQGYVIWGDTEGDLGNTTYDLRDPNIQDYIHYCKLTGLTKDTKYYYKVISDGIEYGGDGSGGVTSPGAPWNASTAPSVGGFPPFPFHVKGRVFLNGGVTPANNTLVYLYNNRSAGAQVSLELSAITNETGHFSIDISAARHPNWDFFSYGTGDVMQYKIVAGINGSYPDTSEWAYYTLTGTDISNYYADRGDIILGDMINVKLVVDEWNLITVPKDVGTWSAWDLANDIETKTSLTVVQIANWTYGWQAFLPHLAPTKNNFTVEPTSSYMVYVTGPATDTEWEVEGDTFTSSMEVQLGPGWNNVGIPYHGTGTTVADDVLTQVGADASKFCRYNSSVPSWESWDGSAGSDFDVDDGQGHRFVKYGNARGFFLLYTGAVPTTWTPL